MTTFQEPRKNWADTQEIRPRQIFHPTSIAEISQIIQDANADDRRVRAIGSLWSFTDVALSHDYLIELDQMNFVLSYSQSTSQGTVWWHGPSNLPDPALDQGTALTAIGGTTTQRLVHTLAGITIQDLYIALDSPETDTPNPLASGTRTRWALPTQGGSAGQTLAGAISTGTHGADFDLPPIPDIVRAIELIAPDGSLRWFDRSPDKGAIFDPNSFARVFAADPLAPVLLQDDDAFYAILVSMGCMGVITSLVIEVTDQFGLSQRVLETNWSTVKQLIQDGSIFGALPPWPGVTAFPAGDQAQHPETDIGQFGNPVEVTPRQRGVEVFLNPYRLSDDYSNDPAPDRRCLVVSHAWTRDAIDPPASSINPGLSWIEPAIILNTFLANPAGSFVRQAIDATMNSARGNSVGYPVAWSVYDGGGASQPVVSIEIAVINTNQGAAAFVDAILSAFDSIIATDQNAKLASFFTLRFTQTSSAFLAMQNFDATTEQAIPEGTRVCHVEIGCLQDLDPLGTRQIGMDTVGRPIFDQLISAGQEHLVAFETLAIEFDAHLHWGEYTYTNRQDPAQYGHFDIWLEQRNSLTNYGEFRAFDNDFTEKYGISSSHSLGWTNTQAAMLPESPTGGPDNATEVRGYPPSTILNSEGFVEVFAINCDNNVCWSRQNVDPLVNKLIWSRWGWIRQADPFDIIAGIDRPVILPWVFQGRIAAGLNSDDGHPEIFVLNSADSAIYHAWRGVEDQSWSGWNKLDGDPALISSPDVVLGGDGFLALVAREASGPIVFRNQNSFLGIVGWSSWQQLPDPPWVGVAWVGDPAVGCSATGLVEVFTRDANNTIWQTAIQDDGQWQPWNPLYSTLVPIGDPIAITDQQGRLNVFCITMAATVDGVTEDPVVLQIAQGAPGQWAGQTQPTQILNLAYNPLSEDRPAACVVPDGLCVAVTLGDGSVQGFRITPTAVTGTAVDRAKQVSSQPSLVNLNEDVWLFAKVANDIVEANFAMF